ncbi:MAG: Eco57I restriction-modification methylase domain-containing protein [Planctomycetota bacterium]
MESRTVILTPAAHKHGNLNIRPCGRDFFPPDVFGGPSRVAGLGRPVILRLDGMPDPVMTDIPTDRTSGRPRWIFRERKWLKRFIDHHRLAPRDAVTLYRVDESTYFIGPTTRVSPTHLFELSFPPVLYAQNLAEEYLASHPVKYRKQRGQYFTPPGVASFMARLATTAVAPPTRILDPGAGTGTLSCAVCEQLVDKLALRRIHIDAYENDPDLRDLLYRSFLHASHWARNRGTRITFRIFDLDFIHSAVETFGKRAFRPYDLVISNPPYGKISANDPRAKALSHVVYGQPNLYALFMAASVPLLKEAGCLLFIVPRSYTAGHYFKAFREDFFSKMQPLQAHLFNSRNEVFSDQAVLQENMILKATKAHNNKFVVISSSTNASDLDSCSENRVPLSHALFHNNGYLIFRLPLDDTDDLVIEIVDSWKSRLADYGLQISTGPVVPFRAKHFLRTKHRSDTVSIVPLLWMCNVCPMTTVWPCSGIHTREAAQQFIVDSPHTRKSRLVLPNKNMVLLRRLSAKEQKRRLTAAPLFRTQFAHHYLGIQNHVNYIYRPQGRLTDNETLGLAAILNSTLLDRYFRICNGNTQVGAIELRNLPLPPLEVISGLGTHLRDFRSASPFARIDASVYKIARSYTKKQQLLDKLISCDA